MASDLRYPREGEVYEAIEDVPVGYMTHYFNLPYTGGGNATLSMGEQVRVSYVRGDKPVGVYCNPLRYEELHQKIVGLDERSHGMYRGYCLAINTELLNKSFKLVAG